MLLGEERASNRWDQIICVHLLVWIFRTSDQRKARKTELKIIMHSIGLVWFFSFLFCSRVAFSISHCSKILSVNWHDNAELFTGQMEWEEMLYDSCKGPFHRLGQHSSVLEMDFYPRLKVSKFHSFSFWRNCYLISISK